MSWRKRTRDLRAAFALRVLPRLRMANYWLIAQVAMAAVWLLRRFPAERALAFADRTARRVGPLFGRHRTALDNLRKAFPDKSEAEIETIALDMWSHMARLATEYLFLDDLYDYRPEDETAGRVEVVGKEIFQRLAAETGRPHIIFTAHLGNFELLPIAATDYGMKVTALFRPPNNPYIARYLLSTRKTAMGPLLPSVSGVAFSLANELSAGGNIGVLVDQKFGSGVATTLFGRPCETNPILPMLARRFECDVYPAYCHRLPGNRFRLVLEDRLELARNARGDIDVRAVCQQLNDTVERWIRTDPAQWMWFHKRWNLGQGRRARRSLDLTQTPKG